MGSAWFSGNGREPVPAAVCRDFGGLELGSCPATGTVPALTPNPQKISLQPGIPVSPVPGDIAPDPVLEVTAFDSVGPWFWLVLAVLVLLVVLFCFLWLRSAHQSGRHHDSHTVGLPQGPPRPDSVNHLSPQPAGMETLVAGLISIHDLSDSPGVGLQVQKTLAGVGIVPIVPDPGTAFDIEQHAGSGSAGTLDPGLDWHISSVRRPGWRSADSVIRPAEVIVYQEGATT